MIEIATYIFVAASLAGVYDLVVVHLVKQRLYARSDSRKEHIAHTVRSFWQVPLLYLLFAENVGGELLWAAAAVVLIDIAVEGWDLVLERKSRRALGGLPHGEYLIHMYSTMGRSASFAILLSAKSHGAWSALAPHVMPQSYPWITTFSAMVLIPSALVLGLVHLWLLQPRYLEH